MSEKLSRWQRFKRYLKRNCTKTWAQHFCYQIFALAVSICMVVGVANYAVTKSYDERTLNLLDTFTITAHQGAFDTNDDAEDFIKTAINNNVDVLEVPVRQKLDGTLVMSSEILVTNNDGVFLVDIFNAVKDTDIIINLNIKDMKALNQLYDMVVEHEMTQRVFLTGIFEFNVSAIKESNCSALDYYIEMQPSRLKIFGEDYANDIVERVENAGAVGVSCNYRYAGARLAEILHNNGYKLSVDGVNSKNTMKRILMAQPDNVVTKQYDMLLLTISNWGK